MKQNYLYKCTDCETVKSVSDNLGESTWVLSCKSCGSCVTEHYKLVMCKALYMRHDRMYDNRLFCLKEKEEIENDSKDW